MSNTILTNELRRFIYSIASVPHLEAILLLYQNREQTWNAQAIAQRLYISHEQANNMLLEICQTGICGKSTAGEDSFVYAPVTEELGNLVAQLAQYYPGNLIEVTNMVHTKTQSGRVQLFADAFKFNKDT